MKYAGKTVIVYIADDHALEHFNESRPQRYFNVSHLSQRPSTSDDIQDPRVKL